MTTHSRSAISLSETEVADFLEQSRKVIIATVGPSGQPHLVPMWFVYLDGAIHFHTKAKSQKIVNLRRDNRVTASLDDGDTYATLRGVVIEGTADVLDDPDDLWRVGVATWERYNAPYREDARPLIEATLRNRVAVRVNARRLRSWDHRKLG